MSSRKPDEAPFCIFTQPYVNSESVASMSFLDSRKETAVGELSRWFVGDNACI
jgi:hypothetical protein